MEDVHSDVHGPAGESNRLWWLPPTLIGVWTLLLAILLAWELVDERDHAREVAKGMARTAIERDLLFRRWNVSYGGVYVPADNDSQESAAEYGMKENGPHSRDDLRHIDQVHMMREVYALSDADAKIDSHITGLSSVNARTSPDDWERKAIGAFLAGKKEVESLETIDGQQHIRLMRPLVAEEACMECHQGEGFRVGEICGGVSTSVPMSLVEPLKKAGMIRRIAGYGSVWAVGLLGIAASFRATRRQTARRQRIEEALRESRARIRDTTANIPGVVYQFRWNPKDRTYSFPYISKGVTNIMGIAPEEIYADPLSLFPNMLYREDVENILESITNSAEHLTNWHRELQFRTVAGEVRWIRANSRPHALPDGDVIFNGVFVDVTDVKLAEGRLQDAHDILEARVIQRTAELQEANRELRNEISERKRAEQWLLKSEEQLRSFFELGVIGMAVTSPDKYWEEVNPRLCELLGYGEHELTRKTWEELTHPDDIEAERILFDRMLSGVMPEYVVDKRFVRKNGSTVHAILAAKGVYDSEGAIENLVMLIQDVGEKEGE